MKVKNIMRIHTCTHWLYFDVEHTATHWYFCVKGTCIRIIGTCVKLMFVSNDLQLRQEIDSFYCYLLGIYPYTHYKLIHRYPMWSLISVLSYTCSYTAFTVKDNFTFTLSHPYLILSSFPPVVSTCLSRNTVKSLYIVSINVTELNSELW